MQNVSQMTAEQRTTFTEELTFLVWSWSQYDTEADGEMIGSHFDVFTVGDEYYTCITSIDGGEDPMLTIEYGKECLFDGAVAGDRIKLAAKLIAEHMVKRLVKDPAVQAQFEVFVAKSKAHHAELAAARGTDA
jgi:hypothetical protein